MEELRNLHKEVQETAHNPFKIRRRAVSHMSEVRTRWLVDLGEVESLARHRLRHVDRTPDDIERKARDFRRKKLVKTSSVPAWYKNRHGARQHVLSGAARVRKFRPGASNPTPPSSDDRRSCRRRNLHLPPGRIARPPGQGLDRHCRRVRGADAVAGSGRDLRLPRRADAGLAAGRRQDDRHRRHLALPGADEGDAVLAFILSLPWVFYQLWAFIAPGLYAHEKRLVLPLVILVVAAVHRRRGVLLLLRVRPRVPLHRRISPTSIAVTPDIENYLDFVMARAVP
jgi:hypothetical protein